jgi:hypothetical protein
VAASYGKGWITHLHNLHLCTAQPEQYSSLS